jgi:hypothetical protein
MPLMWPPGKAAKHAASLLESPCKLASNHTPVSSFAESLHEFFTRLFFATR